MLMAKRRLVVFVGLELLAVIVVTAVVAVAVVHSADDPSEGASAASSTSESGLDTGSFATTAVPSPYSPNAAALGAERLADYVALPSEIDPELTVADLPAGTVSAPGLDNFHRDYGHNVANESNFWQYGFSGSAVANETGPTRRLTVTLVRAFDAQIPMNAANEILAAGIRNRSVPTSIPNHPDAQAYSSDRDTPVVHAALPYGDYLVDVTASDSTSSPDLGLLHSVVSRAFDIQIPLVDQAQQLSDNALPPKGSRSVSDNQDDIRGLVSTNSTTPTSVYGPRAVAHFSTVGDVLLKVLTENEAEHNAYDKDAVYIAQNPLGAETIEDALIAARVQRGWQKVVSPQGLPDATCLEREIRSSRGEVVCTVQHQQYVAETTADHKRDAQQAISARYLVLAHTGGPK